MWPSRSAYTMFCAGTANDETASRKLVQSVAVLRSKIASAVRDGVSAVQARDTAVELPLPARSP